MASAASAWMLIKNVEMKRESVKTIATIKIDDCVPCKKKLNVETKPAIKKCEQMR
jgi:hypothetical protein